MLKPILLEVKKWGVKMWRQPPRLSAGQSPALVLPTDHRPLTTEL